MRAPSAWLIIGFLSGCAQGSIPPARLERPTNSSGASSVVTSLELARLAQSGNLMAALQQLRPWFLTARDEAFIVSVDGVVFTDASVLRTISVADVCEVQWQRGASRAGRSAVLPNGRVSSGGDLIEVSLRPCSRQ